MTAAPVEPPRLSRKAVASCVLGVLALALFIVAGLPAMVLGWLGLREVNASDGRLRGRGLAIAGLLLGSAGSVVTVAGLLAIVFTSLREGAQRLECLNNLRQMGIAANLYHDAHGAFPAGTIPNDRLRPDQRLSWLAALLPYYMEAQPPPRRGRQQQSPFQAANDALDRDRAWDDPANQDAVNVSFRAFLCPSAPDFRPHHEPGLTNYVGIAGIGANAAELPRDAPRAGVFGCSGQVKRDDITRGLRQTMMATETTRDVGPWAAGGPATVRGVVPGTAPYVGFGRPFGGCHPKVANVLFCDGSAAGFAYSSPPLLFEEMATIHGPPGPPPGEN
ncbi:MAG TPA: DUF1559 domain-containing protein [Gemmataceae bacterium]|nr:DUF1559 domain-containing protein [Gemmataceae bacterium]